MIICKTTSSRYLFKNFIGINDNQENVLKVIKATKLLEEEITRATNKIDKTTIALNVNIDKEHIVMLSNIKDIDSLTNYQNAFEVKQIETLKMKSSNFSKFADNFLIIKRLYEDENKSIDFIAKLLRISKSNLQL